MASVVKSIKHIINRSSSFRAAIDESARKCFDQLPIVQYRTGMKLFKQKPLGPIYAQYHIPENTKIFKRLAPDYKTPEEDRWKRALDKLKRRGKAPPKKGFGKRAGKKK
jgi:hypothetical protein